MEAEVELLSRRGSRRVKLHDFYKGYKQTDLAGDEFIVRVHLPLPAPDEVVRLYKVSRRNDLDIATFGAAIRLRRTGDVIGRAWLAKRSAWLIFDGWVIGAAILLLAGLFQFSSLKYRCLEGCRSPLGFVLSRWAESRPRLDSLPPGR